MGFGYQKTVDFFSQIIYDCYIAMLFYLWQKSHCFLGNREEGIENREEF
ncbi:MAG: hypothetical protein O4808_20255 [Trichodesmium sp. St17_bin3_1_1]|jgi:hypothetical protein|nr:hypothetical protein [Trichodesmium sp. St17_bin3_1_1]